MQLTKKFNFDRFKRSAQGLVDFAVLIEQAEPAIRKTLLEQAEYQDKEFFRRAMRKVVFFEEICYLDETVRTEILSKVSYKILAYALFKMGKTFQDSLLSQMGHREKKMYLDELEKMGQPPSDGLVSGAQKQILKTARQLEKQGKLSFELSHCPRFNTSTNKTDDSVEKAA